MPDRSDRLIEKVLKNAQALLGTEYSQLRRNNIYPGGSMDCSSFIAAIWGAAGYPLRNDAGDELRTSYRQADAAGFALLYPTRKALIGRTLPSAKGLLNTYGALPGDLVFWCFDSNTKRSNKITHVGCIDADAKAVIHTANNRDKCTRVPLSYGEGKVCAILRLQDGFSYPKLSGLQRPQSETGRPEEWAVRMLQAALNLQRDEKLALDGSFGGKTESAVEALNSDIGKPNKACTQDTWKALGFVNDEDNIAAPPEQAVSGAVFARVKSRAVAYTGRGIAFDQAGILAAGTPLLALPPLSGWREVSFEKEGRLLSGYLAVQNVQEI